MRRDRYDNGFAERAPQSARIASSGDLTLDAARLQNEGETSLEAAQGQVAPLGAANADRGRSPRPASASRRSPRPARHRPHAPLPNPRNSGSYIGTPPSGQPCPHDAQRSCSPARLRYLYPPRRKRPVRSALNPVMQGAQPFGQTLPVFMPRHAIHACRCLLLQRKVGRIERFRRDVVQQRSELLHGSLVAACRIRSAACVTRAARPVRALASRIPLGSSPSLRRLRRDRGPFVRRPHRYYGQIRLLQPVHLDSDYLLSSAAPVRRPGRIGALSGPLRGRTCVPGFLDAAEPSRPHSGRSVLPGPTVSALRMTSTLNSPAT